MKVLKYKPNLTLKTLITFIGLEPKTYDEIIEYFKPADYENFTDVFKKLMRSGFFRCKENTMELNEKGRELFYLYEWGDRLEPEPKGIF